MDSHNQIPDGDVGSKLERLRAGNPLRVIDLFAGCGGLSLGLQLAQCEILGGLERDPIAARTHANNFFRGRDLELIERHARPHDIHDINAREFMETVIGASSPFNLVDLVVGGPPCQAFARVGRAKLREIMQEHNAHLNDSRATLYTYFLEYVEFFRPLGVLMENVPDIMNFGGQNIAEEIARTLEDMGYRVKYSILNSSHYGVPQMRQRLYLIALLNELEVDPEFPPASHYIELPPGYANAQAVALGALNVDLFSYNDDEARYISPPPVDPRLQKAISAREALDDLPRITQHLHGEMKKATRKFDTLLPYRMDSQPSEYAMKMRNWLGFESHEGVWDHVTRFLPRDYPLFKNMREGDQYPQAYALAERMWEEALEAFVRKTGEPLDAESEEYHALRAKYVPPYDPGKFPNKWRKMERDFPARTLTAHIGKDTYSHIHFDSSQARVISVREAARLQSFPDGFRFAGAMNAAFRQIGNAVPPLQAYALGVKFREQITKAAHNHSQPNTISLKETRYAI